MTPESVVRDFCAAVAKRDEGALRALVTDDVFYLNVGMPPARGVAEFLASIGGMWVMFPDGFDFEIKRLAVDGSTVLTERVDYLKNGGTVAPIPVMGAFDVRDGRVSSWRDYFDLALVGRMMAGKDVSDVVP
jgi:limonene-1,2-epoxide hydrolase